MGKMKEIYIEYHNWLGTPEAQDIFLETGEMPSAEDYLQVMAAIEMANEAKPFEALVAISEKVEKKVKDTKIKAVDLFNRFGLLDWEVNGETNEN